MEYGTVRVWEPAKRFGFITSDDDEELFFHPGDLHPSVGGKKLQPGQRVAFDIKSDMKGDRAVNIRLLKR